MRFGGNFRYHRSVFFFLFFLLHHRLSSETISFPRRTGLSWISPPPRPPPSPTRLVAINILTAAYARRPKRLFSSIAPVSPGPAPPGDSHTSRRGDRGRAVRPAICSHGKQEQRGGSHAGPEEQVPHGGAGTALYLRGYIYICIQHGSFSRCN